MPATKEITIYKFSELSDDAKRKAIDANRDWNAHDDWSEFAIDEFAIIGGILGIAFDTYPIKLMDGTIRHDPKIWFSGFACFEGIWRYSNGMRKRIREYAPNDTELHRIADRLADIQKRWFYGIRTQITHCGRYYHEHAMHFSHDHNSDCELPSEVCEEIEELMRDLARWHYSYLEKEYEYWTSDEAIAESLEIDEMEFLEDGSWA
jgi:hypothetical protein